MFTGRKLGFFYKLLLIISVVLSLAGLIVYTEECIKTGKSAVAMCLETVAPSLFPFFVISNIIIGLGFAEDIAFLFEPVMRRLFNVNGSCACAFILGIVGGYPVGARTAIELYNKRLCTKAEAERLLSFCNNSGPAFILGIVGSAILDSKGAGFLLYAAHLCASITVGILFRRYKSKNSSGGSSHVIKEVRKEHKDIKLSLVFVDSVRSAMSSVINISAFVIFFAIAVDMLFSSGIFSAAANVLSCILSPLGIDFEKSTQLLTGLLEITSGLWSLSGASSGFTAKLAMASFILGWAGISVHCQALSFLGNSGLSFKPYFFGKLLHAILSAAYTYALTLVIPFSEETSYILASQVSVLSQMDMRSSFLTSVICSLTILLAIVCVSVFRSRKT